MPEWETHNEADWLNRITEHWTNTGSAALRSRGHFNVVMDASAECLLACQHLARIDWPWSATRIIPARENCVPSGHTRHCGTSIYKALYPKKVNVLQWETEHMSHQQSVERFSKTLKKEAGEQPKIDLTLVSFSGENTLGDVEADSDNIPEYQLTALYQIKANRLPSMALTPWILQASRKIVGLSKDLNPPQMNTFKENSPLYGLVEKSEQTSLLHTR